MTLEQYDAILALQNGGCAICARTDNLNVDHDHTTGSIRGLLCHGCNVGLGHFRDQTAHLEAAIRYLAQLAHGSTGTPQAG